MASAGHMLIQQSPMVEAKIKTLLNNDLRTICRAYGQAVSGTKIHLQNRCITILRDIVAKGDVTRFQELQGRVSNHGQIQTNPPPGPRVQYSSGTHTSNSMVPRQPHVSATRLEFKNSPFYDRLEVVLRAQDLPEMPQNRHTVKANLILTEAQALRLSSDPEQYRLMVYCAQPNLYNACDIAFPPQIEIKVNEDDVKANFKGLKNKPGSTKPADITKLVRLRAGYPNKLSVCYALTTKRYMYTIYLVRYVSGDALVEKIRANRVFPKHKVLEEIQRLNNDPDIAATSTKMSLKDPVSTSRITVPIRSTICTHNQCFDASFFLQLQEQAPTWQCPHCNKTVSFESLSVDKYFEEILQNTPRSIEQVIIEPNGEWRVVEDDEEKGLSNAAKGAARASYDDDFDDDDIIELDAAQKAVVKKDPNQAALNAFSTPPLSSREPSVAQSHTQAGNKRASTVIDLTLSDDDDEPIRPNKRTRLDDQSSRPHSYMQTPNSMPDVNTARPHEQHHRRPSLQSSTTYPNMIPHQRSPSNISMFPPNHTPAHTFGLPADLNGRTPSHMGLPNGALNGQFTNFRSPSLPGGEIGELSRQMSASKSPAFQNTMTWPPNPNNANTPVNLSGAPQSQPPTYQSTLPRGSFPGWNGDSASPG